MFKKILSIVSIFLYRKEVMQKLTSVTRKLENARDKDISNGETGVFNTPMAVSEERGQWFSIRFEPRATKSRII